MPVVTGVFAAPERTGRVVGWTTDQRATSTVRYGLAPDTLDHQVDAAGMTSTHRVELTDLAPCRIHYFVVESTNQAGKTARSPVLAFDRPHEGSAPVAAFDFDDGPQGFWVDPPEGSGGLSGVGTGVAEPSLNPTNWSHRPEPTFAGSPAMRTVLRGSPRVQLGGRRAPRLAPRVPPPGTGPSAVPGVVPADGGRRPGHGGDHGFRRRHLDRIARRRAPQPRRLPQPGRHRDRRILRDGGAVRVAFHLSAGAAGEAPGGGWAVDDVEFLTASCEAPGPPPATPVAPTSEPDSEDTDLRTPRAPPAGGRRIAGDRHPPASDPSEPAVPGRRDRCLCRSRRRRSRCVRRVRRPSRRGRPHPTVAPRAAREVLWRWAAGRQGDQRRNEGVGE